MKNKYNKLDEVEIFHKRHKLPKLIQQDTHNLNISSLLKTLDS